jgi:hypothetical protein
MSNAAVFALVIASAVFAAEPEDKDLTIMRLQKVIAEQTIQRMMENRLVAEYERIRANYQALLEKIKHAEAQKEKSE